jgi:hypothetical protein
MQTAQVTVWVDGFTYIRHFVGENLTATKVSSHTVWRENNGEEKEFNFHDQTDMEIVISNVTDVIFGGVQ